VFIGGWNDPQATIARLGDALIDAVHNGRLDEARLIEAAERTRRLAAWAADNRSADPPSTDSGIGLAAARRALRVTGTLVPLAAPPHVIELAPQAGIHGPQSMWGLISALTRQWPETTGSRVTGPPMPSPMPDRPLVIAVRDAHRHPWVTATLQALLAIRPDATVVEMGLPYGEVPQCRCYITTFGATAVSSLAVALVLTRGLPLL
jgi:beta-N-acetylhexosaminidase